MFKGHKFLKLVNENWVLDLTEFFCYKVSLNNKHEVISYMRAFKVHINEHDEVEFEKYINVPVKILKEAKKVVNDLVEQM